MSDIIVWLERPYTARITHYRPAQRGAAVYGGDRVIGPPDREELEFEVIDSFGNRLHLTDEEAEQVEMQILQARGA